MCHTSVLRFSTRSTHNLFINLYGHIAHVQSLFVQFENCVHIWHLVHARGLYLCRCRLFGGAGDAQGGALGGAYA